MAYFSDDRCETAFLETDLSGVKLQVSTTSAAIGSHGVTVFPCCFHASPKAAFGLPFKPCGGCGSTVVDSIGNKTLFHGAFAFRATDHCSHHRTFLHFVR